MQICELRPNFASKGKLVSNLLPLKMPLPFNKIETTKDAVIIKFLWKKEAETVKKN